MEREQKNQMLADLYALRAGMSAISIERDKFGVKEKAYSDAKRKVDCACYEYENAENFLSRCDEYDKKDSLQKTEEKVKLDRTFKKTVIGSFCAGIVGALIPWVIYFLDGDNIQDSKYGYSFWKEYLIASACILGIIFVVGLAFALIVKVSNGKDLQKRIKEGSGKSKQDLKDAKARLSQAAADCDSAQKALAIVSEDYEKVKSVSTKLSQEMYNALVAQFKSVLDIRDWEHIDLIIFNFETGRADTLKEALQQVDRRVQTDEIIEAIESAGSSIAATINVTMRELRSDLNKSFNRLSEQLAIQHAEQMTALGNINRNIERTNESIAKLQSATENNGKTLENISSAANLNNALIAKIGYDSMSLMDDVNYMVFTAPKDGGTNNTSYTLNVNVK